MKIGTKSVLFGAHCFFLHPWFVAWAWIKLYGFPFDPRIWIAFFVHDLGYLGKPNMDGPEGETHVEFGAKIMGFLFDLYPGTLKFYLWEINLLIYIYRIKLSLFFTITPKGRAPKYSTKWSDFSMYHSRYYSKKNGAQPSQLCFADKLSFALTPAWLYLPMVTATGEINEYLKNGNKINDSGRWKASGTDKKLWHKQLCEYMIKWVNEHIDGREDTWTNSERHSDPGSAVWK